MGDAAVTTEDLGKKYRSTLVARGRIRDVIVESTRRSKSRAQAEPFWALRHVDLEVMAGQVTGVIGRNGAGKSTLLKLLSRITMPSEGRAEIRGRVGSLLEVGTGFHIDLTGRENVFFSGAVLGMSRVEVRRKFDAIVEFAGVERFIDTPVKHFSSGMQVRLGFAVAAHLEPEVLIVDEVLAVGDEEFQRKCLDKIEEVADLGLAILLVSHDLAAVRSRCDVVHLFEAGQLVASGTPQDIVDTYVASVIAEGPQILSVRGWRLNGGAISPLEPGGRCVIEVDIDVASALERATVTLHIERAAVALWEGSLEADVDAGGHCVRFELAELPLSEGAYELSLSIEGVEGLRSTVPIDPGLEVGPGAPGGPIVAVAHKASITPR
jgi:ABC-type polysaccharide/polyol phosphate transport system ATPase subunit